LPIVHVPNQRRTLHQLHVSECRDLR
jgi:hypothetical protein